MSVHCKTEEELADAIKKEKDSIYVEGNLKNKVVRIKATGKVAWGVCAVALAVAIGSVIVALPATTTTGGAGGLASFAFGLPATSVVAMTLGSATIPAITIGVMAGGIGVLNTLRDKYKIIEKSENYIKLKRK